MQRPELVAMRESRIQGPAGELSAVDHFPAVLTHTNNRQLLALTRYFIAHTYEWPKKPWDDSIKRAESCLAECTRRGVPVDLCGIQKSA